MHAEAVLALLEETGALLNGHFELRSGLHSGRFFQCAHALKHPEIAARLCGELAARVAHGLGAAPPVDSVIAPALGGLIVGHELARALGTPFVFTEKVDNRLHMRRFAIGEGERYIVAEDVITRGGRVRETVDIVCGAGGTIAGIAAIVDRSGGKAQFDYPLYSLVEMEPITYEPADCPLCRQGIPLVHPGS